MKEGCIKRYKTKKEFLSYIKNLLEGYDNMAIMTTIDGKEGIFELSYCAAIGEEVDKVMEGIGREVYLAGV